MCECKDIDIGSYDNQVILDRPVQMIGRTEGSEQDTICIDACIADEIQQLWECGIRTTGCCCGHNKEKGYIGVINNDIDLMLSLGYEVQKNPYSWPHMDTFNLKSVYCPECQKNIAPSNLLEVMTGEHDGFIFVHDDIDHADNVITMAIQ